MAGDAMDRPAARGARIVTILRRSRGGTQRLRTTTTRTRWPLATARRSVAFARSVTAFEHGEASSAAGVATHAQARRRPFGAPLARRSVIRTERVRAVATALACALARAAVAVARPTVAVASATPRDVRSAALPPVSDENEVDAAVAECTGRIPADAHDTTVPRGPTAVSEPRMSAPASASVST